MIRAIGSIRKKTASGSWPSLIRTAFFLKDGARRIDGRLWMHYNAVCVTPAMAGIKPGVGSDYGIAGMDSKHQPLDGAKTYKLHLPPMCR